MDQVLLEFRKYDGSPHWQMTSHDLGSDEYGRWLGMPPGATWQRSRDNRTFVLRQAQVLLCPPGRWWAATFNDIPAETEIYVDISTPPKFSDNGLITAVDLDLDVRRMRDGTVRVEDEDEFADHQIRYGYPDDVIAAARASCDWLAAHITTTEPFTSAYRDRLDRARTLTPAR